MGYACTPIEEQSATIKHQTEGGAISQLLFPHEQLAFGVGGKEWKNGFILSSTDGGNTWSDKNVVETQIRCCVWAADGWVRACGIGAEFHTFNAAQYSILKGPQPRFYRGISQLDSNNYIAVGGEAFYTGFIEQIQLQPFQTKLLLHETNEVDDIAAMGNGVFLAVGFGIALIINVNQNRIDSLPIDGDHFVDISKTENSSFILGISGSVWEIDNKNFNAKSLRRDGIISKLSFFRSICFKDQNEGMIAGDQGMAYKTSDGGQHWIRISGLPEESITCLAVHEKKYWFGTHEGNIYIID